MSSHTHEEILATVTEIVAAELGVPAAELPPLRDLREVEGADSVKILRSVAKIERRYDIEMDDDDVFSLRCLDDAAAVIAKTLAQGRA
ncbi:MAG TPA: acyl carrier protein [Micromonosporaceae bacterium]|nr:acyl carrier protein [Micromonosporaceae bacterium]